MPAEPNAVLGAVAPATYGKPFPPSDPPPPNGRRAPPRPLPAAQGRGTFRWGGRRPGGGIAGNRCHLDLTGSAGATHGPPFRDGHGSKASIRIAAPSPVTAEE